MQTLQDLLQQLPYDGRVAWLGLRPSRGAQMTMVDTVSATTEDGLAGDRYSGRSGKRHATLLQSEHLRVIASYLRLDCVTAEVLRRNILVEGINLLALKGKVVRIGSARLEVTGPCHPCSRMEQLLGVGGYNAVRGHGGVTARVVSDGTISVGDCVKLCSAD